MPANRKWLLLPPAAALLLVLGSVAMQTPGRVGGGDAAVGLGAGTEEREPGTAGPPAGPTAGSRRELPAPPRTPELWQVASTLLGVLVLGGVAIFAARRLRRGAAPTAHDAARLRQVLRLSAKQSLYVVEFEDQLFLIGEGERGLSALHRAGGTAAAEDERQVMRRAPDDDDDDGAVPKDLVIPRPEPAKRPVARRPGAPREPALTDFRALLQKAGKA